MIDTTKETLVTLALAVNLVPAGAGMQPHYRTLWRWCAKGLRGLRLESVFIGGTRYTTKEAIDRFVGRFTDIRNDAVAPREKRKAKRQRSNEATLRHLAAEHGL